MPKKTKREKIISDLRRQTPNSPTFAFTLSSSSDTKVPDDSAKKSELSAIRQDLTKTFVLAAIAITLEFGLYWLTKK